MRQRHGHRESPNHARAALTAVCTTTSASHSPLFTPPFTVGMDTANAEPVAVGTPVSSPITDVPTRRYILDSAASPVVPLDWMDATTPTWSRVASKR
jgi:hypothetical protein